MDNIVHYHRPQRLSAKRKAAIEQAIEYAKDLGIRDAAVLFDNTHVTHKGCVDYRLRRNQVACTVTGIWRYWEKGKGRNQESGMTLERIEIRHYSKLPAYYRNVVI